MNQFRLEGKTCFLAGTGLLGREFALALAEAGAKLFLADQAASALESARVAVREAFPSAIVAAKQIDLRSKASIAASVAQCTQQFGGIDILVNSAAIDPKCESLHGELAGFGAFTKASLEDWQAALDVNLTGAFLLAQAVCEVMERVGQGSIIFLGSNYGLVGPDQRIYRKDGQQITFKPAAYSVTKAGLLGFTKFLGAYYRDTKIRVNMLTPGAVYNGHDPEFVGHYSERTVLGRMSNKEEFRGAILFLASEASSYMTGANLVMDGGWTSI